MKIAFLFREPVKEPLNLREYHISREMRHQGHEIVWVNLFSPEDQTCLPKMELGGFEFIYPDIDIIHSFKSLVDTLRTVIKEHDIQVVWVSGWFERGPRYLFRLLKGLRKEACSIIYDPIDPIYEYEMSTQPSGMGLFKRHYYRTYLKYCYKQCRIIVTVTPSFKQSLIGYGLSEKDILVSMWGTDIDRFDVNKVPKGNPFKELSQLNQKMVIGWLGTMSLFKGVEEILIPIIEKALPVSDRVAFLLAGNGPLYPKLEKVARKMPSGYVTLLGSIPYDQAPSFTAALDCYLVPTNPSNMMGKDIIPVKIFDALAMGIPVIATRSDAVDSLSGRLSGLTLVDWGGEPFLAALNDFIDDHLSYKMLAESGIEEAKCYSHQYIASETAAELTHLLGL